MELQPESGRIVRLKGTADLTGQVPPCARCGYREIVDPVWVFGLLGTPPSPAEVRYVLSAARRLDTAHRLVERLHASLGSANRAAEGSIGRRRMLWVVVGDAEVAIIALGRAVRMAEDLRGEFRIRLAWPAEVRAKQRAVDELREAYEHIDERALGRSKSKGSDPLTAFGFSSLLRERRLTYGSWSLSIDDEVDPLLAAVRRYLLEVWGELNARVDRTND